MAVNVFFFVSYKALCGVQGAFHCDTKYLSSEEFFITILLHRSDTAGSLSVPGG